MSMPYEEIKAKVLSRYGHIDSIPDSTYEALRAYKDKGVSALDDDRTYNILVGERDYKAPVAPKAMTAQDSANAIADKANANAGDAWTTMRGALALPIAGIAGLVAGIAGQEYRENQEGIAIPVKGTDTFAGRFKKGAIESLLASKENRGVSGFASDPINIAPGMGRIASAPIRTAAGAAEGTGLSAVDQYMNTGKVEGLPTAIAGGMGALFRGAGQPLGDKVKGALAERARYKAESKLAKEDALSWIFGHPELDKAHTEMAKLRNEIDPSDLYTQYTQAHQYNPKTGNVEMSAMDAKALLKSVKDDIASRSPIPRKMSSITDREARAHLDDIISKVESSNKSHLVDVAPKPNPSIGAKVMGDAPFVAFGGGAGHLLAGVPGMLIGGALGSRAVRGLAASAIDATANKSMDALNTKAGQLMQKGAGKVAPRVNPLLINLINRGSQQ